MAVVAWRDQINNHVTYPTSIKGYTNGKYPASVLSPLLDPRTGKIVGQLCREAARSWNAMAWDAWFMDGVALVPISFGDSYRLYAVQERIFRERYQTTPIKFNSSGYRTKKWNGVTWYQKPGTAVAAVPGTSLHGFSIAVDFSRLAGTLAWMEKHAKAYGWQWELASEDWHVHFMPGDVVPQAVLDSERLHQHPTPPTPTPEVDMDAEDKKRAAHIERMLVNLPRNGMFDYNEEGGDANGIGLKIDGSVRQVFFAGSHVNRVLVPAGQAAAIFAGPSLDLETGTRVDVQVELTNGKIRWLTFDPHRAGFPGRSPDWDDRTHLVDQGDGWHYFDVD